MKALLSQIPPHLISFIMVTLFSLVIGLSQRRVHPVNDDSRLFGTDRTFTFIGILGFILYIIEPVNLMLFMGGGIILTILLTVNYFFKINKFCDFGLTTIIVALITYCLAPLIITQPAWLYLLIIVVVLVFVDMKETFSTLSTKFEKEEFITLAKFLIIAGVILPIVPDEPIVSFLNLTPYKIWLAVVVISSISYLSYLLRKFVFRDAGVVLTGILAGLYSSTAATIILSRKSKEEPELSGQYSAGIIFATAMKYLRILILIGIFNNELLIRSYWIFLIMFAVSTIIGLILLQYHKKPHQTAHLEYKDKNPLEFKVAIIFTILYIGFTFITYYAITNFGENGLRILSMVVGVTDIDPFLLNLFQGKFSVGMDIVLIATLQAIISNNILKTIYGVVLSTPKVRKALWISFSIIIVVNVILLFLV